MRKKMSKQIIFFTFFYGIYDYTHNSKNRRAFSFPTYITKQKPKANYMKNTKKALNKGFSLVEMLIVIAVIGIIAAIAVPNIGKINDSAKAAKARRNAQNIASVFSSAQAAGLDFTTTPNAANDVAGIVANVVVGASVTEVGPFENTFFGVPNMSVTEQANAIAYDGVTLLEWNAADSVLKYTGGY